MRTPWQRLIEYLARYRGRLLIGGVCVTLSSALSLAKPLVVGLAVDALAAAPEPRVLLGYGMVYLGVAVAQGVFLYLQRWLVIGASRMIEYDMRGDFYDHLQKLPLRFYHEHRIGDLMSRATNDLASARMLIGPAIMHSFSSLMVILGAFIMMFLIEPRLGAISLIAVPVVVGLTKVFGGRIHDRSHEVQEYFGDLSAKVQESLSGMRVVRAFQQERNEIRSFRIMNREYVDRNRRLIHLTAIFRPALQLLIGLLFVVLFYLGSRAIMTGAMTIGDFVAFQFYLGRMIWPLIALGWVINLFQRGMASMARLGEIWNVGPPVEPAESDEAGEFADVDLSIRNLEFAYDGRKVLRDISLDIPHGRTVGIIGRTGSGKSTLLALLMGLYDPPPGTMFLDGRPVETISRKDLRRIIGAVPQETFLFSDTVAENIRFGDSRADDEEIRRVAGLAGLEEDLASFPKGIETIVGERGITLSGGQKQRTAIARAIIRNPSILILDDALSSVDTATEERILAALRRLRADRTVLIVSHRVSSVKDADEIIVLDEGQIVEQGNHEELLALGGDYADLYRQQTLEHEIEEIA